jgi:ABC-type protease/lipase transport system fused ATPase/permease subunit
VAAEPRGTLRIDGVPLGRLTIPLSFAARPREFVAVTGDAAVRSELFAVIARLRPSPSGSVTLDGLPVGAFAAHQFSHAVGLVSPALPLVPGSVRKNLAAGDGHVDDATLLTALTRCRLIDSLPKGPDTRIRMIGDGLAPGIKARIALARALVREPQVLLIDDPVLLADPDGRAALAELAAARERTMLVALDDPRALGVPDREWALGGGSPAGANCKKAMLEVVQSPRH